MTIYSKTIIQFINEIKTAIKDILSREVNLRVSGDRFYDQKRDFSYPIKVVIYNNKKMLGYFDPEFYELGFHACLMHAKREHLHNIIRHELAHYITFINCGRFIQPHGFEFKTFCERMNWGEEIHKASYCLEEEGNAYEIAECAVLRKVKKLMALATSSNTHEAEQAMIKSQQFLLQHNIDEKYIGSEENEQLLLKRILKNKRQNSKMESIARILETFFVNTVYNRVKDYIYLEILGSSVNVEIAEYVASVLDNELDRLWKQAQLHTYLRGTVAKNSFFRGIAKGYCNKIEALKKDYDSDAKNSLMIIEKQLVDAKEMVYPRLTSSKSSARHCRESSALGEQMGRALNINPAINKTSKNSQLQIQTQG